MIHRFASCLFYLRSLRFPYLQPKTTRFNITRLKGIESNRIDVTRRNTRTAGGIINAQDKLHRRVTWVSAIFCRSTQSANIFPDLCNTNCPRGLSPCSSAVLCQDGTTTIEIRDRPWRIAWPRDRGHKFDATVAYVSLSHQSGKLSILFNCLSI